MSKRRYKNEYGKRGICVPAFTALAVLAMSGTALAAGWSMESGSWHYINYDRSYATDCFKRSGDNYFYLDSSGDMLYSTIVEEGQNFYYVNSAGAMVSNEWREVENTDKYSYDEPDTWWYYLGSNGRAIR